jgi:tetratricopeptide (TPR) repeat protein
VAHERASRIAVGIAAALLGLSCAHSQAREQEREMARKRADSHFNIAVDHMESGRVELALRELLMAERQDPKNARIQHAIGVAYLQKGKPVEAERHMKAALAISPDYQDARHNLAALYLNQKRYVECIQEARHLYDDATFIAPWRALTLWGWAAYQLGDAAEAHSHLEYARDQNPRYWPALLDLGILEAEQGNREEAIRYFERVIALDPGPSATAEASYRLAKIYVSIGKQKQAVNHLRTAVVKAPSDPWGKRSEEYLRTLR